jgi:hypothetical protein
MLKKLSLSAWRIRITVVVVPGIEGASDPALPNKLPKIKKMKANMSKRFFCCIVMALIV